MEGGRVDGIALSGRRRRVGKEMAKVGIASFGAHLGALHVVRSVQVFDQEIFRDRFGKRGQAGAAIEFVERSEEWFAGNDIDVNAGALVVPELILERRSRCHSRARQNIGPALIGFSKSASLGTGRFGSKPVVSFFSWCEKEEVNRPGSEHHHHAEADVQC